VNGETVRALGRRADPARDRIAVDGQPVRVAERRTVVLHKPRGIVSTLDDPEGRPTVGTLLADAGARLYPVGRLDVNTTGLLLLTNDGALAAALMHPRHAVPRVYHAKVRGTPGEDVVTRLRRGVRLDDGKTRPARVRVLERLPTKTWLEIAVTEGRNHLVRRMCDAVGHPVEKLARVRLGPLALGRLTPGAWRDLTPGELGALADTVGLRRGSGARKDSGPERRARDTRARRRRPRPGPSREDEGRSRRRAEPGGRRERPRPGSRPRPS
jgi:23S rRNA pseudouridine2605 synthase